MSNFEIISIILSVVNIVITVTGLCFAYKQLVANYKIKRADFEWNKRLEAKNILREYRNLSVDLLVDKFDFLNRKNPIPLHEIQEAIQEDKQVQKQLHDLLNFYQGLANGIEHHVYDSDVIRSSRETAMKNTVRAFSLFIDMRREKSPTAWGSLTRIINEWDKQPTPVRPSPYDFE